MSLTGPEGVEPFGPSRGLKSNWRQMNPSPARLPTIFASPTWNATPVLRNGSRAPWVQRPA